MYQRILQLAGHSVIYGAGSMISKVIAFLMLPLITSYLPPHSMGLGESVMVVDLFAAALFRLGLQNAMMRFAYDAPEGPEREAKQLKVVQTTLALTIFATGIGAMVMGVFAHQLAQFFFDDPRRDEFIWLAAFGMITSVLYATITATFRIQKRPHAFFWVSLGNILLSTFLSLWMVTSLKWGIEGYLLGNFLGFLGLIPIAAIMQYRMMVPVADFSLVKPMLRFAVPTIPMAIAFQSLTLIDRTILAREKGFSDLGIYGFADKFAGVALLVVTALQLSWQPFAYSITDDGEAKRSYSIVTSWFAAVMGWLVVGISLLADPVIHRSIKPAYSESANLVPLLTLAAGIYGLYFLVGIGASRVKRTGWHMFVAAGAVLVCFIGNLALVPKYGVYGAAWADVAANVALAGFMLLRSQSVFRVNYELGRLVRAAVLIAAGVGLCYLLPSGNNWASWTSRSVVAVGWPFALFATGFVSAEERMRIIRMFRRGSGPGAELVA
jgi:O-antigen/teichoic acid export membrane protein